MLSQKTEESIFHTAREIESDNERTAFLDRECGEDQALRKRLGALLAVHLNDPDYLHISPIEGDPFSDSSSDPGLTAHVGDLNQPGDMIGPYKIREQIGEGGMGAVFVAEQTEPVKRRVALKVIKPGMDSKQVIARFEAERQALAMMDHPNIARVIDGGTTESGRPYFAMDLVRGLPISEYCNKHRLDTRARLELFLDVCDAVQHAHQKGIIHRDLKPTNVLVTRNGDRAIPKVIDFGLAKATGYRLTERSIYTNFHQMIGTPLYMSPEQAELSELDVDVRSDIYSLGVILYELMTGDTPFERERLGSAGYDEMRRIIREDEPPRPSERISTLKAEAITRLCDARQCDFAKIHQQLRGELDWVVMKALDKNRQRRYQSASEFADDVRRFLDDEPVEACPPTLSYRLNKYVRRHRFLVASAALVMLTASLGTSASLLFASRARLAAKDAIAAQQQAETEATRARDLARERDAAANRMAAETIRAREAEATERQQRIAAQKARYQADIRVTENRLRQESDAAAINTLLEHQPTNGEDDRRGWEWYYLLGKTRMSDRGWYAQSLGASADWSDDGTKIITTGSRMSGINYSGTESGHIWDVETGLLIQELPDWGKRTARHKNLLACTWDGESIPLGVRFGTGGFQILDLATRQRTFVPCPERVNWVRPPVAWSAKGNQIAARMEEEVKVFREGDEQWTMEHVLDGAKGVVGWSADDRFLVCVVKEVAGVPSTLLIYDGETLDLTREIKLGFGIFGHPGGQCHPSQQWLALINPRGLVIFDLESEQIITELDDSQLVCSATWSPDGKSIAAVGDHGIIRVWNVEDWSIVDEISAHESVTVTVAWSPDSRGLVSMGRDGFCSIWSLSSKNDDSKLTLPRGRNALRLAWLDNETLQHKTGDGQVVSYRIEDGTSDPIFDSSSSESWQIAAADMTVRFTEGDRGVSIETKNLINGVSRRLENLPLTKGNRTWAISPDRKRLATATKTTHLVNWKNEVGFEVIDLELGVVTPIELKGVTYCADCAWSPDGTRIAFVGNGTGRREIPTVIAVDTTSGMDVREEQVGNNTTADKLNAVAWSPDGSKLVVGTGVGRCDVVDSKSLLPMTVARPFDGVVKTVAWHPFDDRIASANNSGIITIWDSISGKNLLTLQADSWARQLSWSPNGQRLAALLAGGKVVIWDASEGYRRSRSEELNNYRRVRYIRQIREAESIAYKYWAREDAKSAFDILRPWVMDHSSDSGGETVHPWAPKWTVYFYHSILGKIAKQDGRLDDAVAAYTEAAESYSTRYNGAVKELSHLISDGMEVDGFEALVDQTYENWSAYRSEWIRSIEAAADPDHEHVKSYSQGFAQGYDAFASIYRRGTADLEKVIQLRERAVRFDPDSAEHLRRLASDYFANSMPEKAVENAEKALKLRPDWMDIIDDLQKYRGALSR